MNSLLLGLCLAVIVLPVNITLTMMSFRYDPKAVFLFIGGAMFFNLVAAGSYVLVVAHKASNLKEFAIGIGLSIVSTMLCKVVMTMRNLHTSDQIKELKKLKAEITRLQNSK
jgi:hypothetical protein